MTETTKLSDFVDPTNFLKDAVRASNTLAVEQLLDQLPIVPEKDYTFDEENPERSWQPGKFHWLPVGKDRGNAGRIKLANHPVNPIAERGINGMEAIIEMARQRELLATPDAPAPANPRDAVRRYFDVPPLDQLPKLPITEETKQTRLRVRDLATKLRVRLLYDKSTKEFTVAIEDDGIGQPPVLMHKTLLSLGSTTKADKGYLIGVFGQGGSSAYAVSKCSWIMSRRCPDLLEGHNDGLGWTVVKHIFPSGRRDDYFAYLAAAPSGEVPSFEASVADHVQIGHGTRFVHIKYDFGSGGSAITRQLYTAMNHVLYNPILPLDLNVGGTQATVYGNGYRLSSLGGTRATTTPLLDKVFPVQTVGGQR